MAGKKRTIKRKYSVVLEALARVQRTVVVRASSPAEAEHLAVSRHTPLYDQVGGWEAIPASVDTFVFDCQPAGRSEPVTGER